MGKKLLSGLVLVLFVVTPLELLAATPPLSEPSKGYSATARISVQDTDPSITSALPVPNPSARNACFMRTQIEILRSKSILNEVASRLNLVAKWAKDGKEPSLDDVYGILRKSIYFNNNSNTSIIEITVKRPDPGEAARIANEVATTFRDSLLDRLHENNRRIVDAYRTAIEEEKSRVDTAEEAVDKLLVELDLPVYSEMDTDVDSDGLVQLKADRLVARQTLLEKESLLKILAVQDGKDLIERAGLISSLDQSIGKVVQQIREIEAQLKSLEKVYGPGHPEVQRYRSQKEALERGLEEHIDGGKRRLETELKLAKHKVVYLSVLLLVNKQGGGYLPGDEYQPLRRALANLENEQFIYKVLDARVKTELAKLETEPRSPVDILSVAEPTP